MLARALWLFAAAGLCAVTVLLWPRAAIPGDMETVHRFFRCTYVALAALLCAAIGAASWVGAALVVGSLASSCLLALVWTTAHGDILPFALLFAGLLFAALGTLVYAVIALLLGWGDPTRNCGLVLGCIALGEAIVAFMNGVHYGWT